MSESTHTPRPWHPCCAETKAHYVFAPDGGAAICAMSHNDPNDGEYDSGVMTISREQRLANARLIAAAPDMLEALAAVADELSLYADTHGADENDENALLLAEKAIAKATGRWEA